MFYLANTVSGPVLVNIKAIVKVEDLPHEDEELGAYIYLFEGTRLQTRTPFPVVVEDLKNSRTVN